MERTVLELQVEGFWDQFHQCHLLECIWHALTDGRRLNQLNSNLLGSPLKDCQALWCLSANYTEYTEWWWCIKVKIVHSMCQGMFLKWLALCFDTTELNAHLPPLATHVLPMGHIKNACARQINLPANWWDLGGQIVGLKQTLILVCISFRMTNT